MNRGFVGGCLTAAVVLASCGGPPPAPAPPPAEKATASDSQRLNETVESYFDEFLKLNPVAATFIGDHRYDDDLNSIGPGYLKASKNLEQQSLDAVLAIKRDALSPADQVTWDAFERARRILLEGFAYPEQLLPLQQLDNDASFFAQLGSGDTAQPFVTVQDYDNFLSRMAGFPAWVDQAIANMREGISRGVVQPRVIMERVLPQLAAQVVDDPERSLFWRPITNMPAAFTAPDRARLTRAYRDAIRDTVIPAYRRLQVFVRDQYLPKTRSTVGLSALPDGTNWYAYRARAYTTTDMPVGDIHELGLREVARIHAEIEQLMGRIGFKGSVEALTNSMRKDPRFFYKKPDELLNAYKSLQARVDEAVPRLFTLMPKAPLEIRPTEPFRERSAAAAEYYQPSSDGSRPGIFFVNTYDLASRPNYDVESIYLHEAVPGHHFQSALAMENLNLPRFRRFGVGGPFTIYPDPYTAYAEGWGLYAESLGDRLGLYTDPYQKLGALFNESWRAVRLVIDTGLHAQGWTREQAIDYFLANTAAGKTDAVAEVERYIALPGQALAYKIGQLTILRLRDQAEKELGPRYDIHEFHAQVLNDGALPLSVLEAKINRWIKNHK